MLGMLCLLSCACSPLSGGSVFPGYVGLSGTLGLAEKLELESLVSEGVCPRSNSEYCENVGLTASSSLPRRSCMLLLSAAAAYSGLGEALRWW